MLRHVVRLSARAALLSALFFTATAAWAQIPAGHIRIHYFRPDGNYLGWTVYAFGDSTENQSGWGTGPVVVSGNDSFGAYFDVGVTPNAANVGIIIHTGNTKDPGPNGYVNPSAQGNEYWELSGSNVLQTTQPPTVQPVDPPIPVGKIRIHYYRPDKNYGGWTIYAWGATSDPSGNWCNTEHYVTGYDTFGAYYDLVGDPSQNGGQLGFIIHNCQFNQKDPGPDQHLQITANNEAWIVSDNTTVFTAQPTAEYNVDPPIPAGHVRIHYYRPDRNFSGWSLYGWGAATDWFNWCSSEDYASGYDAYGIFYDVGVNPSGNGGDLGFIIHNCSTGSKDPGPDQHLQVNQYSEAWIVSGDATVYTTQPTAVQLLGGEFNQLQAYWIDATTVAIQPQYYQAGWTYALNASPTAALQLTLSGVNGGNVIPLTPFAGTLTADELTRYPQLGGYALLKLPAGVSTATLAQALKSQLAVSAVGEDGALKYATGVQSFGAIDALFCYSGPLGVAFHHAGNGAHATTSVDIRVWAPTAQAMSLLLFNHPTDATPAQTVVMSENNGVWSASGSADWSGKYYQFKARVYVPADRTIDTNITTDPWSIDLGLNGTMSRITDLTDSATKPAGWDASKSPDLTSASDLSIYELHVRDFSVGDPTVPAALRGTYEAFTRFDANGMKHLRTLARAGLKAVHLMPTFHIASINEDKSTWSTTGDLSGYAPDSTQQQAAVAAIEGTDGYNWGYDPEHYMAPEGAYATNPDNRVREYRDMVLALHRSGLRVIQDVVFNHTSASGNVPAANLDELVPTYYHRLDANGVQLTGSCCADTASEHRMMEKLMIDTVVLAATQYKVDGFRFDEMSMHFTYNLTAIQQALRALTPDKDGVDGSKIYLYGEGWMMGETANNAIGPDASQLHLFGYGVGTFNDRLRDGLRGGSPFSDPRAQGFATGLATDSSAYTSGSMPGSDQTASLLHQADLVRVALSGNLRDFAFVDHTGNAITGAELDYDGQPAGYAASPLEAVNYCSVHDNQTLFDAIQLKSAAGDTAAMRARRQVVAMSVLTLGQGVPFYLGADDLLRSKDMDNNSYDSGDWFNRIDFSGQSNGWGVGLPIASQNQGQWPLMQPLLANPALKPTAADIANTTDAFQDFLRIRYSSGLFRMRTAADVQSNLSFLNVGPSQIPGVIVMKLDNNTAGKYGPFRHVVVVFNATTATVNFTNRALQNLALSLHPVQQDGADAVVQQSTFNAQTGTATVPALTTAVFVNGGDGN